MTDTTNNMNRKKLHYLEPDVVARIKDLNMVSRLIVEGFISGLHKSPFHGYSVEFAQHRQYAPGDDLKYLDWKLYGKTQKWYIKQYEEETNLKTYMILDTSASMGFTGQSKLDKLTYCKYFISALNFLLIKQRDSIGMVLVDEKINQFISAKSTLPHFKIITDLLKQTKPHKTGHLAGNIHGIAEKIKRRGLVILFSDLLDNEKEIMEAVRHLRYKKHEVILFQVLTPDELDFPYENEIEFIDMENNLHLRVNASQMKESYHRQLKSLLEYYKKECRTAGIDYQLINTAMPYGQAILNYLALRNKK